jgi:hypothetical protein
MSLRWLDASPEGPWCEVLCEQSPGHYPEFLVALRAELGAGGARVFRAASGGTYRLRLTADEHAVVERAGEPGPAEEVDRDLWPLLEWLVDIVGGEWTRAALRSTGSLYRAPVDSGG